MVHSNFFTAICICLVLTACGDSTSKEKELTQKNNETEAKNTVLANLKDPDSAKFGKFTQVNEKIACLTVNARNSMGGYTGDQQATLMKGTSWNGWAVISMRSQTHAECIEIAVVISK